MARKSRRVGIQAESHPLLKPFAISRGRKDTADVVVVEITENGAAGRGECVPYPRYGETLESVTAEIETLKPMLENGPDPLDRHGLQTAMHPGAARNAIDCALWDLEAKLSGQNLPEQLGVIPQPLTSAVTVALDTPAKMAKAARERAAHPLLKIKLGGADGLAADLGRLGAVRDAVPEARLLADVNEGWRADDLAAHADALRRFRLELIEQPLPTGRDDVLREIDLPFCADESAHDSQDLVHLSPAYCCVNIKLDKSGGLTEALEMLALAREKGLKVMVGCMVASSLSMLPAYLLGLRADFVDIDGPLWLEKDRENGLVFSKNGVELPPTPLWGWG